MVSVYIDRKFAWQLPKALLIKRVPTASLKTLSDSDETSPDMPSIWEITDCTRDAFRLFNEWLYSPNGSSKPPLPDAPIKPYFEAVKFASSNQIEAFLQSVVGIVMDAMKDPQSELSMVDFQKVTGSESSGGGAVISGNLAVLLQHGKLDAGTFKTIIKATDMARDVLIWLELFRKCDVVNLDYADKLKWVGENLSKWAEIQE